MDVSLGLMSLNKECSHLEMLAVLADLEGLVQQAMSVTQPQVPSSFLFVIMTVASVLSFTTWLLSPRASHPCSR